MSGSRRARGGGDCRGAARRRRKGVLRNGGISVGGVRIGLCIIRGEEYDSTLARCCGCHRWKMRRKRRNVAHSAAAKPIIGAFTVTNDITARPKYSRSPFGLRNFRQMCVSRRVRLPLQPQLLHRLPLAGPIAGAKRNKPKSTQMVGAERWGRHNRRRRGGGGLRI